MKIDLKIDLEDLGLDDEFKEEILARVRDKVADLVQKSFESDPRVLKAVKQINEHMVQSLRLEKQ